jgi:hypothetical protein
MTSAETIEWLTHSLDALFVVTAACALYFRWSASRDPKIPAGERPSWGGEITPVNTRTAEPRPAAERATRASLWLKFLWVSMALAALANLAT